MTEKEKLQKMYKKQDPETQKLMKTAIQYSSEISSSKERDHE